MPLAKNIKPTKQINEQAIFHELYSYEYELSEKCPMLEYHRNHGYNCKKNREQDRVTFRFCKKGNTCLKIRKTKDHIKAKSKPSFIEIREAKESEKAFMDRERESLRSNGEVSGKRALLKRYGIKAKF